jgi:hypothetical protein
VTGFRDPKFVIAYTIIIGFAGAYIHNPDATMNGALIGAFAGAWGFYLGSSSGQSIAREQVGKALDLAASSVPPSVASDISLAPGEKATVSAESTEEQEAK